MGIRNIDGLKYEMPLKRPTTIRKFDRLFVGADSFKQTRVSKKKMFNTLRGIFEWYESRWFFENLGHRYYFPGLFFTYFP